MARGKGTTTAQMQNSPKGSVFVWVNGHLDYPKQLARKLQREDLRIVSPGWLADERWQGLEYPALVLDHACDLTPAQWVGWNHALPRARPPSTVAGAEK